MTVDASRDGAGGRRRRRLGRRAGEQSSAQPLGIPGYDQVELIGQGGFGAVYKANQIAFERTVAVKILPATGLDAEMRRRFEQECRALERLSGHPHVVTVFDAGFTEGDRPYITMAYAPGGSLADLIRERGPLPWEQAVDMAVKLTGALERAHRSSVLHRDVKPENVLFTFFGEPELSDFGFANAQGGARLGTSEAGVSMSHAAPELFRGGRPSVASDLYSLASTIHTVMAGREPFLREAGESDYSFIARILTDPPPDLAALGVPQSVGAVLERGMAKDPGDRQATVEELGADLQRTQQQEGLVPTPMRVVTPQAPAPPTEAPPEAPQPAPQAPAAEEARRRTAWPSPRTARPAPAPVGEQDQTTPSPEAPPVEVAPVAAAQAPTEVEAPAREEARSDTAAPSREAGPSPVIRTPPRRPEARPPTAPRKPPRARRRRRVLPVAGALVVLGALVAVALLYWRQDDGSEPVANRPSRIAFTSGRDGNEEVYVMNTDGSGQTNLSRNASIDTQPTWSPDGKRIAFTSGRDQNLEIYVMKADGSGQRRLTRQAAADFLPAWSPDGERIAFSSARDGNVEIYTMDADGGEERRLTTSPAQDFGPTWSPDSRRIAFTSTRQGPQAIYTMNADGSAQYSVKGSVNETLPSWSRKEARLAFTGDVSTGAARGDVYTMNGDGTGRARLTTTPAAEGLPSWSPDGTRIAFQTDRDGNAEIYVMKADGTEQARLTFTAAPDQLPSWSPGV